MSGAALPPSLRMDAGRFDKPSVALTGDVIGRRNSFSLRAFHGQSRTALEQAVRPKVPTRLKSEENGREHRPP